MVLKKFKPTSPGQRHRIKNLNKNIYKGKPCKKLCKPLFSKSGRNNYGKITVRHRGGGVKKHYRIIDFKRNKLDIYATVLRNEYDPNRNSFISLLEYSDLEKKYIISPNNLFKGDKIISSIEAPIKIGNTMMLKYIPLGIKLHCLEIFPGRGAQYIRSAGNYCQIISKSNDFVNVLLRSEKILKINSNCRATIGEVSNSEYKLSKLGKAGLNRLRGIRPTVRGVAMNPVDHPHGGGEGKTSGGRDPVSYSGLPTKGYKTVKK